jgi:2-oxoglutarate ferredoxin oxidoreductase subunit beta
MFRVKGFAVIEVLSPCIIYTDRNAMGDAVDLMKVIKERSTIDHNANLADIDIDFSMKKIVLGNFAKRERPVSYG